MDLINTENIFAWGTLIAYFTHGIITGWSYSLCFKVKVTKPVYMAIMIIATAVILVPSVFFNFYAPIKSIVLFFIVFLVLKLLSESNFVKSFIFCCFDMLINVGLELLLLGLLNLLGMNDFYDVSEFYTFSRMVSAIVFAVICIPFKYLYALLWNRIVNKRITSKLNLSLILFPFAEMLAIIGVVADHLNQTHGNYQGAAQKSNVILTVSFITFIVADIVYMYFISDIEKKAVLEREVSSLKYARQLEEHTLSR